LPVRPVVQECNDRGGVGDNKSRVVVKKHDNDDDGEDGAGSRLAHLLELRHEGNILVLVSRWYGGIQLGSKRFVHISNVARQVLEQFHATTAATTSSAP
jgi:putative IMPACT (imprinted ancient) family translation regulator